MKEVTAGTDGSARSVLSLLEDRLGPGRIFCMDQVHSDTVVSAEDLPQGEIPRADAIVSRNMDDVLCVRTADCVPVLAWSEDAPVIAAIHAGWRGLALGIVEKTVAVMRSLGAREIRAAIGPAVGGCCYEVKSDVVDALRAQPLVNEEGAMFIDLPGVAFSRLERSGVTPGAIEVKGLCTACDAGRFNSYRRQGATAGRNISVIGGKSWLLPGLQAG